MAALDRDRVQRDDLNVRALVTLCEQAGQQRNNGQGHRDRTDPQLADEPLSHLDADQKVQLRAEIKRLQKLRQVTSILVTHDQTEASAMADRIDPRITRTTQVLTQAIVDLAAQRPVSRISVAELAGRAGVTRATFYNRYGSPLELLIQVLYADREPDQGVVDPESSPLLGRH